MKYLLLVVFLFVGCVRVGFEEQEDLAAQNYCVDMRSALVNFFDECAPEDPYRDEIERSYPCEWVPVYIRDEVEAEKCVEWAWDQGCDTNWAWPEECYGQFWFGD